MYTKERTLQVWVGEKEKIVSFHAMPDYAYRIFDSREQFINFLRVLTEIHHFRVQ